MSYKLHNQKRYERERYERERYERDVRDRQREHLKHVRFGAIDQNWQPCQHEACTECHGTHVRRDGSQCIHAISCQCPKCTGRRATL